MADDVLRKFAEAASHDLGRLLQGAAASMNAVVLGRVTAQGHPKIRPSHLAAFTTLDIAGTHISVLASRANISRQAMGVVVRELEALGYLHTAPDAADRRATIVTLTDRGVAFCALAIEVSDDWNSEVESLLGADNAERLRAQLRAISGLFAPATQDRASDQGEPDGAELP